MEIPYWTDCPRSERYLAYRYMVPAYLTNILPVKNAAHQKIIFFKHRVYRFLLSMPNWPHSIVLGCADGWRYVFMYSWWFPIASGIYWWLQSTICYPIRSAINKNHLRWANSHNPLKTLDTVSLCQISA